MDQVTDVLAFPDGSENPENGLLYLGDVVIAYPFAALQAHEAGHSPGDEIQLLVVHGLLHLLGYDHHGREEESRTDVGNPEACAVINRKPDTGLRIGNDREVNKLRRHQDQGFPACDLRLVVCES